MNFNIASVDFSSLKIIFKNDLFSDIELISKTKGFMPSFNSSSFIALLTRDKPCTGGGNVPIMQSLYFLLLVFKNYPE